MLFSGTSAANINSAADTNVDSVAATNVGTQAVNMDNYANPVVNTVNANTPVNLAAAWAGNSGLTATSSVMSLPDNSGLAKGSGVSKACFRKRGYVKFHH